MHSLFSVDSHAREDVQNYKQTIKDENTATSQLKASWVNMYGLSGFLVLDGQTR